MTTSNPNIQQKLKFLGYKVYSFSFNVKDGYEPTSNDSLKLEIAVNSSLNEETKKGFSLSIQIVLTSENQDFELVLNSKSTFETDSEINSDYLSTGMVTTNSPAIVFPFLRAYINTVTTNAGYQPLILPAINFAKLGNKHSQ